jgi:hypothetical protein
MFPIVTMTVTWVLVVARLVIAVQLTRVARRQKLPNLLWLAAFFYLTGIGDIFATLAPVTNLYRPFLILVGLSEIMMVMFIQKTFYQDRKGPFLIFMGIAFIILAVDSLYAMYLPYNTLSMLWLLLIGIRLQENCRRSAWDTVKARYKLDRLLGLALCALWTLLSLIGIGSSAVLACYTPQRRVKSPVGFWLCYGRVVLQYLSLSCRENRPMALPNYQPA